MEMSPYYANMRVAGVDESKARKIISDRAAEQASFLQGSVGALGGVFTSKLITGKLDNYFTSNIRSRLARIVALGGVGAAEEGTQEFLEGIAADVGIDKEVIKEIGEESFANLVLGSLGGGAVGSVRGAISPTPNLEFSKEDQAIADLDRLAAEEEAEAAEAGVGPLVSEADLFPEEAGIPLEETVPATLDELKKIDKDLRKKLGRPPTTDEVERALNDFEREKTRRLRVESGRGEPSVPVSGAEEAGAGVAGALERIEPRGLGAGVGPAVSVGARKEPTLGALKPEDTYIYTDIAAPTGIKSEGNVPLQNYFKAYYGFPPESLPKAASVLMPLLQRTENLAQRYLGIYSSSNQPAEVEARSPEYREVMKLLPSGFTRRLANTAFAIDKNYKTKANDPEKFAKETAEYNAQLDRLEAAIAKLPLPLTAEEKQAREEEQAKKGETYAPTPVPEERQLQALVNLLRREPERLSRATNKQPVYIPSRQDPAKLQAAVDAGLTTQDELDLLQRMADNYFAAQQAAAKEKLNPA
jgi:hypothetical protein